MKLLLLAVTLFCTACTAQDTDEPLAFALAAIHDNILSTDFSALVEITNAAVQDHSSSTTDDHEALLVVIYKARVLESFLGNHADTILFTEYREKDEGLESLSEGKIIISLCKEHDGTYYLPDIGYEMPADSALLEKAREIKRLVKEKKLTSHRDTEDYACLR